MAKTLKRSAAFTALARALMSGARGGPSLSRRLAALPRMMKATARGEYDGGKRVLAMAAAAAYGISPIDFIPEGFFLIFGLADDAVMITWLAGGGVAGAEHHLGWGE